MRNKGFVLIEMMIYIGLFSIIMGGLVVTAYQLSESTSNLESKVATHEEINFVSKKIDWIFTEASDIQIIDNVLEVTKGVDVFELKFDDVNNKIKLDNEDLTTVNVAVSELSFTPLASIPKGVKIVLTIDGVTNTFNKYLKYD